MLEMLDVADGHALSRITAAPGSWILPAGLCPGDAVLVERKAPIMGGEALLAFRTVDGKILVGRANHQPNAEEIQQVFFWDGARSSKQRGDYLGRVIALVRVYR